MDESAGLSIVTHRLCRLCMFEDLMVVCMYTHYSLRKVIQIYSTGPGEFRGIRCGVPEVSVLRCNAARLYLGYRRLETMLWTRIVGSRLPSDVASCPRRTKVSGRIFFGVCLSCLLFRTSARRQVIYWSARKCDRRQPGLTFRNLASHI